MAAQIPRVTVAVLIGPAAQEFGFSSALRAGDAGLARLISSAVIQKTGLALVGLHSHLHSGRPLILAESEIRFLQSVESDERVRIAERVFSRDLACVIVTEGLEPPTELLRVAIETSTPVLVTALSTPLAISRLTALLEDQLAPHDTVHGVLVDVLGLGVLLVGDSGLGKSECALDLIVRGHRLVADDAVDVRRRGESVVLGSCPALTRHHMEIRGIGLINVTKLFGVAATRSSKRVELVIQLERWSAGLDCDRLGLDDQFYEILGVAIPLIRLPVAPGRNLANLIEVASRDRLLREQGHHAARELVERATRDLERAAAERPRADHGE